MIGFLIATAVFLGYCTISGVVNLLDDTVPTKPTRRWIKLLTLGLFLGYFLATLYALRWA